MVSTAARALRWLIGGVLLLTVVAAAALYSLIRTQPGQDFVLRTAVGQLANGINGRVDVGAIRSVGLLSGFTLREIAVADSFGRSFVQADSIRVEYSLSELLQRNIVLVPAEVWGLDVTIETLHGDERSNVERIFGGGEDADTGGGAGVSVALRRTAIHDGTFVLRMPLEDDADPGRIRTEILEGTGAGRYRVMRFEAIEARIPAADVLDPDLEGQRIQVGELSLMGHVFEEPFRLVDVRGEIARSGSSVRLSLERLWLPESEFAGQVEVGWGGDQPGVTLAGDLEAHVFRFADFRWLEPRLPNGGGELDLSVSGPLDRGRWRVTSADIESEGSRVRGSFGIDLGDPIRFAGTDLELLPLRLESIDRWLAEPLAFQGLLRGEMSANGPLAALELDGRLTFEDPERDIPASTAEIRGTVEVAESPGATNLEIVVDPLRYETLRAFLPDLEILGSGRAEISASGRLENGVQITAEALHEVGEVETLRSLVSVAGTVARIGEQIRLQLAGELDDLSLEGIGGALGQSLPIGGDLSGTIAASGLLSDLSFSADLQTPAGRLQATGRTDAQDPARNYRVDGRVEEFALHEWATELPRSTVLTGEFHLDGSGFRPEDLSGSADLLFRDSRVLGADLSHLGMALRASGGRLRVDDLDLRSPVITVQGFGDLALQEDQPAGELSVTWAADSLAALRPVILGDQGIVADTLTQLEREVLRFDGIDPDTLSTNGEFAFAGSAEGTLVLRGGVHDLRGEGFVQLADAVIGEGSVRRARADLRGRWAGEERWEAEAVVDFDSLAYDRFTFARGSGGGSYGMGAGDFDLTIERSETDRYRVAGDVARDSAGVSVGLRQLAMRLDDAEWELTAPSDLRLEGSRIGVQGFRLVRTAGPDEVDSDIPTAGASIEARGTLDLEGESEFDLELIGADLTRLERIAQTEALPGGIMDLAVQIRGPSNDPRIDGEFAVQDFTLDGASLSLIEGTLGYDDRVLQTRITGERDGRRLVRVEGRIPADLSFHEVEDRFPSRELDLTFSADSLPVATALAFLETVEQVEGTLDGSIHLGGTPDNLRPSGSLRLDGGALVVPDIGLRTRTISAQLTVREDFEVEVEAEATAGGIARVSGTIALDDLTDPGFDLAITASGFHAVNRSDLTTRLGGEIRLGGSYRAPRVSGQVDIAQGELFLEEFARGAEVIDLSDPAFFDVVDTTLVATRSVVQAAQNPFMQNLRVDVDLSMENDFWIRSQGGAQGMDVELAGDLIVTFDRPAREILLVGNLEALRGTYSQLGRQFEVQSGSVEFVGTPGINPSLAIQAVYRLRREGNDQLNIIANLQGTLQNPRVSLTSDSQPPIPESDLISYLIFGEPSYNLGSGETSVVERAVSEAATTALNLGVTQLASTFTRQLGVDYLSVSQARRPGGIGALGDLGGGFANTQIEMGRYLAPDVFFALILRPLTGLGATGRSTRLPGARLEYGFMDYWTLEGYLEDRLARQGGGGFGDLDRDVDGRVFGVSLFRDWGY